VNEQLKIIIAAEVDKLKQGCKDAVNSINEIDEEGKQTGKKVDSHFAAMGNAAKKAGAAMAKGLAVGISAAAAGVVALTKAAVEGYAEFEQLKGGIETLFKDSASTVANYANEAYKSSGLSANAYMETVTGFSASMLAALGGDTKAAAEASNNAVIDMADNANKMGTSMEMIQNAYAGFAKGNYTMLDNLKLGYGGTKEEMDRLLADAQKLDSSFKIDGTATFADITKAIRIVQTELGITGATAAEAASTISGSTAMTKAAWDNLVVGIADDNADFDALINNFVDSATTALGNILPRVQVALGGVVDLIKGLAPVIIEILPELVGTIVPMVIEAAISIVNAIAEVLPQFVSTVVGLIPQIISALAGALPTLLTSVVGAVAEVIKALAAALPDIVTTIVELIPTLITALLECIPDLLEAAITLLLAIVEAIPQIIPPLLEALPEIIDNIVTTLINSLPLIIEGAIKLLMGIISAIPQILPALVMNLPKIITQITKTLIANIPTILKAGIQLFTGLINAIPQFIVKLVPALGKIVKSIKDNLVEKAKNLFSFKWELPKLKLPHFKASGEFSLNPPSVPTISVDWYARGGVFDSPTLFPYGNGQIGGLGEAGAEAIVPLENNTEWLDKIAARLQGGAQPIVLQVDGKTFAEISVDSINQLTKQRGSLPLVFA
jgi:phage-related protein